MAENTIILLEDDQDVWVSFKNTSTSFLDRIKASNSKVNMIGKFEGAGISKVGIKRGNYGLCLVCVRQN